MVGSFVDDNVSGGVETVKDPPFTTEEGKNDTSRSARVEGRRRGDAKEKRARFDSLSERVLLAEEPSMFW